MGNNNTGRTFWDLLAEKPIVLRSIMVLLAIILIGVIALLIRGYTIKTGGIVIEKPIQTAKINEIDSLRSNSGQKKDNGQIAAPVENKGENTELMENKKEEVPKRSEINVSNSPGSIVTKDQKGDNLIINPEKPKIVYYKNDTKSTKDNGWFIKKFYFAHPEGLPLRNLMVKITFDSTFENIDAKVSVWTGMVYSGGEKLNTNKTKTYVEYFVPILAANNYIEMTVKSINDIEVKDCQYEMK